MSEPVSGSTSRRNPAKQGHVKFREPSHHNPSTPHVPMSASTSSRGPHRQELPGSATGGGYSSRPGSSSSNRGRQSYLMETRIPRPRVPPIHVGNISQELAADYSGGNNKIAEDLPRPTSLKSEPGLRGVSAAHPDTHNGASSISTMLPISCHFQPCNPNRRASGARLL